MMVFEGECLSLKSGFGSSLTKIDCRDWSENESPDLRLSSLLTTEIVTPRLLFT